MPRINGVIQPLSRNARHSGTERHVNFWFGDPCASKNFSTHTLPLIGRAYCHNKVASALQAVFKEIVDADKSHLVDMNDYGGIYNCRRVGHRPPPASWSPHAWAIAVDLNVHWLRNPNTGKDYKSSRTNYNCEPEEIPSILRQLQPFFEHWGFAWGGHWRSPDPMHFEATEITLEILKQGGPPQKAATHVVVLPGWQNSLIPIFQDGTHLVELRKFVDLLPDYELVDNREVDGKLYVRKVET